MPSIAAMLAKLIEQVRGELQGGVIEPAAVEEALAAGDAQDTARQVLQAEVKGRQLDTPSEIDLWDALVAAICDGLHAETVAAATVAGATLGKRLKAISADANRRWLFLTPATTSGGNRPDYAATISTGAAPRFLIDATTRVDDLHARIAKACAAWSLPVPGRLPFDTPPPTPVFLAPVQGSEDSAFRQGLASLGVARDALRFAVHARSLHLGLGPLRQAPALKAVDSWLLPTTSHSGAAHRTHRVDAMLDGVDELEDAKTRTAYDAAARVLEACPERMGANRADLAWRLARSLRVFGRAVDQANRDIRFLLLMVALEALLSRNEPEIAARLSEWGALLAGGSAVERGDLEQSLKKAYDHRSRFVHAGQVPSERLTDAVFRASETAAFGVWARAVRRLLDFSDQAIDEDRFFAGLAKLREGATLAVAFELDRDGR